MHPTAWYFEVQLKRHSMKNSFLLSSLILVSFNLSVAPTHAGAFIHRNEAHQNILKARYIAAGVSTTPEGSVVITKGSLKDTKVNYSDPRSKHTQFSKYTQAQLEQALKSPNGKLEQRFADAVKAKDNSFGGQLNSDAIGKYSTLVKDAVESGIAVPNKSSEYYYEATFTVGVDIATGKGTKRYQVVSVPNGTHIFPFEYPDKIK
jgi:hypothetical protein